MLTPPKSNGLVRPWDNGHRFSLRTFQPAPTVARLVEQHWMVRWDVGSRPYVQEILPHPSLNMVVDSDGAFVWGVPRRRGERVLEGSGWAVGTKLRPGAFTACTGIPADRLTDGRLPFSSAFASAGNVWPEAAPDHQPLEAILLPYADVDDSGFDEVVVIVGRMRELAPDARVEDIARHHSLSSRTLQRLFARYVGVPPKWVLKRLRIHEAVAALTADTPPSLARLAVELGYYDQAHFVRDFRTVVGRSPGAYAGEAAAAAL